MDDKITSFISRWFTYIFISFAIIGLDYLGVLNILKSTIESIANPATSTISTSFNFISQPIKAARFAFTGAKRVADLERRLAETTALQLNQLQLQAENESMRKLLGSDFPDELNATPVSAIYPGTNLILTAGKNQGLEEGSTVISSEYTLLGRVNKVSTNTSWVATPSSTETKIPVVIANSQTTGILTARDGEVIMEKIGQLDPIMAGQIIVTSGTNGLYMAGIPVGTVISVESKPADLYKTAIVELFKPENSGTVFIVKP